MIKFGLDEYTVELSNWTKHHKELSLHIKREYLNAENQYIESKDTALRKLIANNEDKIMKEQVKLYDRETFESFEAIDYYLPLKNLEYPKCNIDYYSIGGSNASYESKVRLHFQLEYTNFILDYSYKTSGSAAMSFHRLLNGFDGVLDIILEVAGNSKLEFSEKGIMMDESGEGDFYIVGLNEYKRPIEFSISRLELLNSLVAVEIYKHKMTIK